MNPLISTVNLPYEIVTQLSGSCQHLLQWIHRLCYATHKRSPSRAWYCFPSEKWLAGRMGRNPEHICRCIQRLHNLELIHLTHRRWQNGRFQTNLYKLGKVLLYWLNAAKSATNRLSYHLTEMSNIVSNTMLDKNQQGLKQHLMNRERGPTWDEIAQRLEEKMFGKEG